MLSAEEIAALVASGVSASDLADRAGVHLRTAYKWLTRHKPRGQPTEVPPDFDRASALTRQIDRAIMLLDDDSAAAVDRLLKLARAAKHLSEIAGKATEKRLLGGLARVDIIEALTTKLERAAKREDPAELATDDAPSDAEPPAPEVVAVEKVPLPKIRPNAAPEFGGNVKPGGDFWKVPDNRPAWIGDAEMRGPQDAPAALPIKPAR